MKIKDYSKFYLLSHPIKRRQLIARDKLMELQKEGYLFNSDWPSRKGWKLIGFDVENENKIELFFKSEFEEEKFLTIKYNELDIFISKMDYSPKKLLCIEWREKEFIHSYEKIIIGLTKDYNSFKIPKILFSQTQDMFENLMDSFLMLGNLFPIIVIERNEEFFILDGKKRFNWLKSQNKDIFYLNVTSLLEDWIGQEIEINEKFLLHAMIKLNMFRSDIKLEEIWPELSKYYHPEYKKLEEWMKQVEIEKYMNKFDFIKSLEPNLIKIYKGEANFSKAQEIFNQLILDKKDYIMDINERKELRGTCTMDVDAQNEFPKSIYFQDELNNQNIKGVNKLKQPLKIKKGSLVRTSTGYVGNIIRFASDKDIELKDVIGVGIKIIRSDIIEVLTF